jgi:KaiC/GvpD/RAD55 family RecA-like ATPase
VNTEGGGFLKQLKTYLTTKYNIMVIIVMERASTGIEELDRKIGGGYPRGRSVLITGTTGSGKTILGLHFIHHGCIEGRKCMIIATEEIPEDVLSQAESLGMNLKKFYESGLLTLDRVYEERTGHAIEVLSLGIEKVDELQSNMLGLLDRIPEGTENVLIDNIGVFTLNMSPNEFRAQFDSLIYGLREKHITSIIIMDSASDKRTEGIAAYSVYGVLRTSIKDNPYSGARERILDILKIRNTKVPLESIKFDITSKGIVLLKKEKS